MKVTVAICTWNRAALLDRTLAGMTHLRVPDGVEWELLVVNNNCSDDTDRVLSRYCQSLPLRRVFESRQGLCHARNAAIREATGELLVWTDDDVLVDVAWLQEYLAAAALFPEAAFLGGTIEPWFESPPPRWVRRNLKVLEGPLVIRQLGMDIRALSDEETPFGANMAFRTSVLRRFRFDTSIGHVGDRIRGGDETDVMERLRAGGFHGVWVGTARVRHYVPRSRMSVRYLAKWCRDAGSGQAERWIGGQGAELFGMPRWALRSYVQNWAAVLVLGPLRGPGWARAFMARERLGAFLRELRRLRACAKPTTGGPP
jgi:glycosyltransferase involved in cell wall biosynthesis